MYGSNVWIINLGAGINHCQRRSEMKEKKTCRETLLRALYISCSMHRKILKLGKLVWIIIMISNHFDSLRFTRIYMCQRGMSARYSVIRSGRDTFFDRLSRDVSTICYPLAFYPSTGTWETLLRKIMLKPRRWRWRRCYTFLDRFQGASSNEYGALNRAFIDDTQITSSRFNKPVFVSRRDTRCYSRMLRQRRSYWARTDLRLRRTYATPGTIRPTYLSRHVRLRAPCSWCTFNFHRQKRSGILQLLYFFFNL